MSENNSANQTPCWRFDSIPSGGMERASITGEFFSKNTPLESVIREGIQNSLDARANGKGPVRVRVYYSDVGTMSLPAAKYKRYLAGAEDHLDNPGNGLRSKPGKNESCAYLVLEDFNTNGLSGNIEERPPESEKDPAKWNYHNSFFRESNSSKDNDGKLGSWGAGKATFSCASRLRTAFAYSVRDVQGDQRRFLAARMTLNVHVDAQNVRWEPHAWFGLEYPEDTSNNLLYTKRPILEKGFLDEFAKDFNLSRGDNPGTSIVIPYLNLSTDDGKAVFNKSNLVRAVVRNFLTAFLQGDLVVDISTGDGHDKVTLDKTSIGKHSLPDEPKSDDDITKTHYSIIREALSNDFPPSRVITLKNANPGKTPVLDEPMFEGIDLKAVKKLLQANKPVLFKVPMSVLEKSDDGKKVNPVDGVFKVVICRADFGRQVKAVYYRLGLLIGGIRKTPKNASYAIATLVDKGPVAKMLVAAEPPSHNEWNKTERLNTRYDKPGDHIAYVRDVAQFILSSVENSDNEADWDLLSDDFGIPDEGGGPVVPPRKPHEKCPVCHQWPCVCPKPSIEQVEAILTVTKVEGEKTGFRVDMAADRILDAVKYPFTATFLVSYPPLPWSEYDFKLNDKSAISIEYSGEDGVASYVAKDNRLTITVNKPGAFGIEVTGFDKNRDLMQKGPRYKYPEAE